MEKWIKTIEEKITEKQRKTMQQIADHFGVKLSFRDLHNGVEITMEAENRGQIVQMYVFIIKTGMLLTQDTKQLDRIKKLLQ